LWWRVLLKRRLAAGAWLTACTYPIVVLALPAIFDLRTERTLYLAVAGTYAPVPECLIFWLALGDPNPPSSKPLIRDLVAIVAANLASFGIGQWMTYAGL
jgi:hypothetical protein